MANKFEQIKITHGGYICAIIDAGAGTAVYRNTSGKSCVTISLDIKFISMTKLNDEIKGKVKISSSECGEIISVFL